MFGSRKTRVVAGAMLAIAGVLGAACVPPSPLPEVLRPTTIVTGTVETVREEVPEWKQLLSAAVVEDGGLDVGASVSSQQISVSMSASVSDEARSTEVIVRARGCRVNPGGAACPEWERQSRTLRVPVDVVEPSAVLPDGFLDVDPGRWISQADGRKLLPDELTIFAVEGSEPADVVDAITGAGGGLTGSSTELDYYQARFDAPVAAADVLDNSPFVDETEAVYGYKPMTNAEPKDWEDDHDDKKWTFRQADAVGAWDITTGDEDVELGIIDNGIYPHHPDLRPVLHPDDYTAVTGDSQKAWPATDHGTHVASTMCSADRNGGLVGVAHKCRIHALDLAGNNFASPGRWIEEIRAWLDTHRSLKVVNISLGIGAHERNGEAPEYLQSCSWDVTPNNVKAMERTFARHENTLFVVAGGNCGGGGRFGRGERRGVKHSIPQANDSRTNVLTVAATATKKWDPATGFWETRSPLAFYSATDAEIAAPGGEEDNWPVWSAVHLPDTCEGWPFRFPDPRFRCDIGWGAMQGTSQAAPFVSGTAGLMLAVNPDMTADDLVGCLQSEANVTEVYDPNEAQPGDPHPKPPIKHGLREINVRAAVECAQRAAPGTGVQHTVNLTCRANSIVGVQTTHQTATDVVQAPESVAPGETFDIVLRPPLDEIPSTEDLWTIHKKMNIRTVYRIPEGVTVNSVTQVAPPGVDTLGYYLPPGASRTDPTLRQAIPGGSSASFLSDERHVETVLNGTGSPSSSIGDLRGGSAVQPPHVRIRVTATAPSGAQLITRLGGTLPTNPQSLPWADPSMVTTSRASALGIGQTLTSYCAPINPVAQNPILAITDVR